MLAKYIPKEFFDDRPLMVLSGLAVVSALVTIMRVILTVRQYDFKVAVGYTQYGADSFTLGDWYILYEFAAFAFIATCATILIAARLLKIDRSLSITALVLHHIVLIFLFIVSGALLSASSIGA